MTKMRFALGAVALAMLAAPSLAEEKTVTLVGQKTGALAGNFRLNDANGKVVELAQFRGRTVVLEWTNPGCPFVQKHYVSGNMQRSQAAAIAQGAVWLTINSSAPGKQGHMTGPEAQKLVAAQKIRSSHYLLDPKGVVGRGYAARTTPHMFVIAPDGILVYQGGIDDKPTANRADVATARNFVSAAIADVAAGRPVAVKEARPYGCSVKYEGVS